MMVRNHDDDSRVSSAEITDHACVPGSDRRLLNSSLPRSANTIRRLQSRSVNVTELLSPSEQRDSKDQQRRVEFLLLSPPRLLLSESENRDRSHFYFYFTDLTDQLGSDPM